MSIVYRVGAVAALLVGALTCAHPVSASDTLSSLLPARTGSAPPSGWTTEARVYAMRADTRTIDPLTSLHADMTGAMGVLEYRFSWLRLGVIGTVGNGHLAYLQALQDIYASSKGLGVRAVADVAPFLLTFGASFSRDSFQQILQNGDTSWNGSEREFHVTTSGRFDLAGPLWVAPLVGFRHLELQQDLHLEGSQIIPDGTRTSEVLFAAAKLELELHDQLNNIVRPWAFGGVIHEFNDQPPIGPSIFVTDGFAGNQYTVFSTGTFGAPTVFPSHDTKVFGLGFDLEFSRALVVQGSWYREFNSLIDATNYRLTAAVRW